MATYTVRTDSETCGIFTNIQAARKAAKAKVAGERGAVEVGCPAWADDDRVCEAYSDRDGDEESEIAVILV